MSTTEMNTPENLASTEIRTFSSDLNILMEKIYDVIIIGAGASGIGASMSLTKKGIEHIILEARDRIGGRISA